MGRPSLIETEVHEECSIAIRGRAMRVLRGELMLPAFAYPLNAVDGAALVQAPLTNWIEPTGCIHGRPGSGAWHRADRQPTRAVAAVDVMTSATLD